MLSEDKRPLACTTQQWAAWIAGGARRRRTTRIETEIVETSFPGFTRGDEPLFVTLVYGQRCAGMTEGYADYAAAMRGHEAMCDRVRAALALPPLERWHIDEDAENA
jgi:hypothetical protein